MATLNSAFAFTEMDDAGAIADNLHLDMAHARQIALDIERVVAERRLRLGLAALPCGVQFLRCADDAHAAPASAGDRLDHDGAAGAKLVKEGRDLIARRGGVVAVRHGNATGARQCAGLGLVTKQVEGFRGRTDEGDAFRRRRAREGGALGEEAVAGMHGVAAGARRGLQQRIDRQIGRRALSGELAKLLRRRGMRGGAVVRRRHRNGGDTEFGGGAGDPQRDFPAVGDQNLLERHGWPFR